MKIQLTEEQQKALLHLLDRVQLQGSEVQAFNQIVEALKNPVEEEKSKNK